MARQQAAEQQPESRLREGGASSSTRPRVGRPRSVGHDPRPSRPSAARRPAGRPDRESASRSRGATRPTASPSSGASSAVSQSRLWWTWVARRHSWDSVGDVRDRSPQALELALERDVCRAAAAADPRHRHPNSATPPRSSTAAAGLGPLGPGARSRARRACAGATRVGGRSGRAMLPLRRRQGPCTASSSSRSSRSGCASARISAGEVTRRRVSGTGSKVVFRKSLATVTRF